MKDPHTILGQKTAKKLLYGLIIGLALMALGMLLTRFGGGHEAAVHAAPDAPDAPSVPEEGQHHAPSTWKYLLVNLWINNVYFTGLSLVGVLFVAIQYAAGAGWPSLIRRVPEVFGYWLPYAGVLMLGLFLLGSHDLFHWTDATLYQETLADGSPNPAYDPIVDGKKGFLNVPFYVARMVVFFLLWYVLFRAIRKYSLAEDREGSSAQQRSKMLKLSAVFIIVFALSSSVAAWDWVMSIDVHWFSTMFGWYVFASWWVAGLALITYMVVLLKEQGYLPGVNANHLHDLSKYIFGFSIFWAYIWFSQFLLIYYANIPEESVYFVERWTKGHYAPLFFINVVINFFFPFLLLMTRDAKRHALFIKIVCPIIIFGHWLDFYLMITPGTLQEHGGFGPLEIGTLVVFMVLFLFVLLNHLRRAPLKPEKDPMLEESIHHYI